MSMPQRRIAKTKTQKKQGLKVATLKPGAKRAAAAKAAAKLAASNRVVRTEPTAATKITLADGRTIYMPVSGGKLKPSRVREAVNTVIDARLAKSGT
jgi:hypothetical protein